MQKEPNYTQQEVRPKTAAATSTKITLVQNRKPVGQIHLPIPKYELHSLRPRDDALAAKIPRGDLQAENKPHMVLEKPWATKPAGILNKLKPIVITRGLLHHAYDLSSAPKYWTHASNKPWVTRSAVEPLQNQQRRQRKTDDDKEEPAIISLFFCSRTRKNQHVSTLRA